MTKTRRLIQNILIAGYSLVFTIFLIDLGLRIMLADTLIDAVYRRPELNEVFRLRPNIHVNHMAHGNLISETNPTTEYWPELLITDEYGYRNAQVPPKIDTVVLGDSFGYAYTTQDQTLSAYLADCGRSVYNLSVPGASLWQEYATLEFEGGRLPLADDTTVVWLPFSGNDLDGYYLEIYGDDIQPRQDHPGLLEQIQAYLTSSPLSVMLRLAFYGTEQRDHAVAMPGSDMLFYETHLGLVKFSAEEIRTLAVYPRISETFAAMGEYSKDHHLHILVAVIPSKEELYYYQKPSGFAQVIGELADQNGMSYIDMTPDFMQQANAGKKLFFTQDTHWNEAGQHLAANLICRALADEAGQ